MWIWLAACGDDPTTRKTDDTGTPPPACSEEVPYDGVDQDCDGADLVDVDGDGSDALEAGGRDCDDGDDSVRPGADEVAYDGVDQDCDGVDLVDVDGDGHDAAEAGGDDCDDGDGSVAPGAADTVGDGVDQSCDGVDGTDADGDGAAAFGTGGTDCDDADAARFPGAEEVWYDGVDQDCDRVCDYDQDGDGAVLLGSPVSNGDPCDTVPGPEAAADQDCDDADAAVQFIEVQELAPSPGEVGVASVPLVTVWLTASDPSATLELESTGGVVVAGTVSVVDALVTFVPDAPLDASTEYVATLTWACGSYSWSFVTDLSHLPVDPHSLVGTAWEVDLLAGDWSGSGLEILIPLFTFEPMNLTVVDATDTELDLIAGAGSTQDLCLPTNDIPGASFAANPTVTFLAPIVTLDLLGTPVDVGTVVGSAVLGSTALADGSLNGQIDTRPLVDLLAPGGADDAVCDLVAVFGVSCVACADGTGAYCLQAQVSDLSGSAAAPFVPVTQAEVDADPSCP